MIHLRNRTEFSFGYAVGRLNNVLMAQEAGAHAGICDRHGTWGHVRWSKECKATGHKPLFGVELALVERADKEEKQHTNYVSLLAHNDAGLREIYRLMTAATRQFYYTPRIDYGQLTRLSEDVIILSGVHPAWEHLNNRRLKGHTYIELNQLSSQDSLKWAKKLKLPLAATDDNLYVKPEDLGFYQVIMGKKGAQMRTAPAHILQDWEFYDWFGKKGVDNKLLAKALKTSEQIANSCNAKLPQGTLLKPKVAFTLEQLCRKGMKLRKLAGKPEYEQRLKRELDLIQAKRFEDYFHVVADMIRYAKQHMFVGPARGSACGSLVCYLLGITDIDPLPHDLMFERFIDINREDYPDIDIDFQDDLRDMVFDYLKEKYGPAHVGRLGTISVFKAKSALTIVSKELQIPFMDVLDLKNSIIERSTGDSRAAFCIADTFEQLQLGKEILAQYPELALASELEGHASHTGMHSAGIVITAKPVINYCAFNERNGVVMLDKFDAEALNLLKIDALGLRTLSVLQDTLDQIGWKRQQLKTYPLNDQKAFDVLNRSNFAGIFQFEGYALQSVTKQLHVSNFNDICHITALARPGPLNSGGTTEFLRRRSGETPVKYLHPLAKDITKVTYGVIVYQEQVMQIARTIGALSWEDVSQLRKAMSKTLGKEFFDQYWDKFWFGAKKKGLKEGEARTIWDNINTMGSWAFNRSHAVAYGTISYWCCVLKSQFPLEFAAANLRKAKSDDQSIKVLRELVAEGYEYKPFDPFLSQVNWTVAQGKLIGGLSAIRGVGQRKAEQIIAKRNKLNTPNAVAYTPSEVEFLNKGKTPFDKIFEAKELWGKVFKYPERYNIKSKLTVLNDIVQDSEGEFVFIAKLTEKNLRDHNEVANLAKRGGVRMEGQTQFLNGTVEDDTSSIFININRQLFERLGRPLIEDARIGDWFLWKGTMRRGFRKIYISRWIKLTGNAKFTDRSAPAQNELIPAQRQHHERNRSAAIDRASAKRRRLAGAGFPSDGNGEIAIPLGDVVG